MAHEPKNEIVIAPALWDVGNPEGIYKRLPKNLGDYFFEARMKRPDLFDIGEDELRERIRTSFGRGPGTTENVLRLRFWMEYFSAFADQHRRNISVSSICAGFCDPQTFYAYMKRPEGAAWIACQPMTHETHLEEMLNYGASRAREIMGVSPLDPVTKKVDVKLARLQMDLYHAAELRALGAIPQVQKNLNYNVSGAGSAMAKAIEEKGTISLENKIEAMENGERALLPKPPKQELGDVEV